MTWSPRNRCEDDDLDDREDGDQRIKESESKRSDKEDERRRDEHHHSRPGGGMCVKNSFYGIKWDLYM